MHLYFQINANLLFWNTQYDYDIQLLFSCEQKFKFNFTIHAHVVVSM